MANNADSNNPDFSDEIAKSAKKLKIGEVDWRRPPSQSDVDYLIDHSPFLQIIDTSDQPNLEPEVKIIKADSEWNIHYYGDAMSSSPGEYFFGGGDFRIILEDEEGGASGGKGPGDMGVINPGKGTFRNQAFLTANEMVAIAKKMGWKGVQIIDGHPLMKWAAWLAAKDQELPVYGYKATTQAEEKRARVKRSRAELEIVSGYTPRIKR